MSRSVLYYILVFITLLLSQVLICNHIILFDVASLMVFIYLIISMPLSISVNFLLTIAFFLGLIVDLFSDTLGVNCLASVVVAMSCRPVLSLYNSRENYNKNLIPTLKTLGFATYFKYLTTMVFIYFVISFVAEYFSFMNFGRMSIKIFSSTLLTTFVLIGIDSLIINRREKRL